VTGTTIEGDDPERVASVPKIDAEVQSAVQAGMDRVAARRSLPVLG
jgi:hypothetical protein